MGEVGQMHSTWKYIIAFISVCWSNSCCSESPRHAGTLAKLLSDSSFFKDIADRASQLRLKREAGPPLSAYLWESTSSQREQARNSKFITGLEQDNLDPTYFGAYMVQDAVYIYRSMQSIEIAANKATDPKLKQYLQKASEVYKTYYQDMFKTWRIKDANGIELSEACANYSALENKAAKTMNAIYLVVALIPCEKLWPWLGQQISASKHKFGVYESWIEANLNPSYDGYKILEKFIDDAFIVGEINKEQALDIYKGCMTGEANFFNFV